MCGLLSNSECCKFKARGPGEEEAEAVAGEVGAGAAQEPHDRETRQASDGAWTSLRGAERPVEDFNT